MQNPNNPPQPRTRSRRSAFMVPLLALLGLSSASAAVTSRWIEADFNGDGRKDLIATTNLADIVFNAEGEVIGWYPKIQPGQNLIEEKDGKYGFNRLKNSPNLVRGGKALQVVLPGNTEKKTGGTFKADADISANRMSATFTYQQGDATVTKNIVMHPRQFKLDTEIGVQGAQNYRVNFDGLGNVANPAVKAVESGDIDVETDGTVRNIEYAALQEEITNGFLGLGSNSYTAMALIVKPGEGTKANVRLEDGKNAQLSIQPTTAGSAKLIVYGGRNELIHLYQEGFYGLPGLFQPNIWGQLSLQVAQLMEWLYGFLNSWFLVIVAITLLIRLAIWPLMQSQARYTAKLQYIQPEVQKLNEKYKDDPQKRAEATMQLYREHNVNPAGCLPIFIQFPFLIVLWGTIRNFEFDSGFLWLPDLAIPDPIYILAVLYVGVNILSLYVTTRKMPEMFKQQAFIYLFFAYFALTFPAGVTLYWILGTIFTIGQQLLINKQMEAAMAARNVERVPPSKPKPSGTQQVLPKNKRQKE